MINGTNSFTRLIITQLSYYQQAVMLNLQCVEKISVHRAKGATIAEKILISLKSTIEDNYLPKQNMDDHLASTPLELTALKQDNPINSEI